MPDSFAHPAKMDAQLLIWIVERYTVVGETILDPMAGSGTMMLACTLGRNVILVELEEKFCKMMQDNWEQVQMRPQLGYAMGNCQIMQGDARNLKGVVDKCIFSPPYAEANQAQDIEFIQKAMKDGKAKGTRWSDKPRAITNPDNPSNIGNLPYGQIDKIVTSPPYAQTGTDIARRGTTQVVRKDAQNFAEYNPENPDNLGNLGNLPYGNIDAVVTSPPYEESIKERAGDKALEKFAEGYTKGSCISQSKYGYSQNESNIGNLKSASYLEAMLQVYAQCWSVLKDGGLMILVTKNFIRQKQVIRLDTDTRKLCEQAGFTYLERHYRKLPSQSFWRIIYHQKHPEVEQILYEDALVFRKVGS